MAQFKKGDSVVQVVEPIKGTVDGFQVDQENGGLLIHVSWKDADGNPCGKYFDEAHLAAA
jgi:hypothetical protein